MGGFSNWLWTRWKTRYVPVVAGLSALLLNLFAVGPVVFLVPGLLGVTWLDALVICGISSALINVTIVCGTLSLRSRARPIHDWARGHRSDPEGVWNAALEIPKSLPTRSNLIQAPFQVLVTAPVAAHLAGFSWLGAVAIAIAIVTIQVGAGVVFEVGLQRVFRPLMEEVVPLLPPGAVPRRPGWTLRDRLLVSFWTSGMLMSAVGGAGAQAASSHESAFTATIVLGAAFSTYFLAILAIGIVGPTLRPVADLVAATRRVARGDFTGVVSVTTADEVGELTVAFNQMQVGLVERASLHAAFGSYVDPVLTQRLLASGSSMFGGEEVGVTVMFADVRSFTSFAEGVTPAVAVDLLNRLFDTIVPVIHEHGGHANHYLGDGLLAVFGAPHPLPGHADAAVRAAVDIQRAVRALFEDELRLGIGINSGPVIAGTVGGGGRHEFTVIGDTVNVAARVEQLTKETGDAILITEATRAALTSPRPRVTKRGEFDVRGKASRIVVHAVNPFPRPTQRSTR